MSRKGPKARGAGATVGSLALASWMSSSLSSPSRPPAGAKGPRERVGKDAPRAAVGEKRKKGAPAKEPPKPAWALLPTQRRRQLLLGDRLEDAGAAASIFPRESADPRPWSPAIELPTERQNRLLGVLKAAEARARVRALRLRYARMRAEEIELLIQRQGSARAAIRLELLLPPHLKPTKIQDPLDRQERRRVETILEETADGSMFR